MSKTTSVLQIRRLIKLERWSYTAWSVWHSCAYKFGKRFIEGEKETIDARGQAAMDKGNLYHKKQEYYLKGEIDAVPKELKKLAPELKALKKTTPIVEQFWGVSAKWKPTQRYSWCVMKMDAAVEPTRKDNRLFVQDLKSGREYPEHAKQGELYAAIGFALYPKIDGVDIEFWYADEPAGVNITSYRYERENLIEGVEYWREQGSLMLAEKKFLPSPSDSGCRFCTLRSDRGGKCGAWKALR